MSDDRRIDKNLALRKAVAKRASESNLRITPGIARSIRDEQLGTTRSILASLGERAVPLILAFMLLAIIATQCDDPQPAPVDPGPAIEGSEG